MESKKILSVALALVCAFSFCFVIAVDDADASPNDIKIYKEADWSKFTDFDSGSFYVYLENTTDHDIEVKVTVFDGVNNRELDNTVATIPAGEKDVQVKMTFKYSTDGEKLVYFSVVDTADGTVYVDHEGSYNIHVEHSIWKNTSVYVILVVVIIAIIVIAYFVMRNKGRKAMGTGKTFTQLEEERKAKKTGKVAQKEVYQSRKKKD